MFSKARKWQIGIATLIFVISILLGYEDNDETANDANEELSMQHGDYYLRNTRMILTNSTGQPIYNMTAKQMDYYAGNEYAELTALALDYFANNDADNANREHWQFTAQQGFLPSGNIVVELTDRVTAKQLVSTTSPDAIALTIDTERLDIYLQQDIAVSPAATIRRGQDSIMDHIDAKGLTINMQTNMTEMAGGIRAQYTPQWYTPNNSRHLTHATLPFFSIV